MSISEAESYVDSLQDLSEAHKTHLNTLLYRSWIHPEAVLGRPAEALRRVIARNPLTEPVLLTKQAIKLTRIMDRNNSGVTPLSPVSDAAFYRNEMPEGYVIPTYDHVNPPAWLGHLEGLNDPVLPAAPVTGFGVTESDLVRTIYPFLDEILSSESAKLVNSETDKFLPMPSSIVHGDLYNKPDLHLIHPALYKKTKEAVNGMVFGKPDVSCLNSVVALLEAKLPDLAQTQIGVLLRYVHYWYKLVRRNVSGIVFNEKEFVYGEYVNGVPGNFLRCRWDAVGSRGLLKRLLVDLPVKSTEAVVISQLCARLNVRLCAEPGTSYLGRGTEAIVLKVTEVNGGTVRALKYYSGADHNSKCRLMCQHTTTLINSTPAVNNLIISHIGEVVTVDVGGHSASGVLIRTVGTPVSQNNFTTLSL